MLDVHWRRAARLQLESMIQYIRDRNIPAAAKMESAILASVERLRAMPFIGRPGRVKGTREWVVHPNYLIIYRVAEEEIVILRILHARQAYP